MEVSLLLYILIAGWVSFMIIQRDLIEDIKQRYNRDKEYYE